MIHMPRRSVTRFFIPLIDVLLLLFCIFLLMPFVTAEDADQPTSKARAENQADEIEWLKEQLRQQEEELAKLRHLRSPAEEIKRLQTELDKTRTELQELPRVKAELDKLRAELKRPSKDTWFAFQDRMRTIHIDGVTEELFYYDGRRKPPLMKIDTPKAADQLIERLQRDAGEDGLFVQFIMSPTAADPRPSGG